MINQSIINDYQAAFILTQNAIAAAILVLANQTKEKEEYTYEEHLDALRGNDY